MDNKGEMRITTVASGGYITRENYEISTDLPQDEVGEYVTLEIIKAWKSGRDPVKDGIVLHIQFA